MGKIDELIKQMCPEGVKWVTLVNYCNVQYGYPFDSTLFCEDSTYIPLIRIRDVVPGVPSTYYSGEIQPNYIVKEGDILVGMDGNFNLARWKSIDGLLNQRVCKLYSKDENELLNGFIFHYMKPVFRKIEQNTAGGSVKHLSAKAINSIEIPLPPLPIQEAIVEILDKFDRLSAELQAELQARKTQYEYYRNQLLTRFAPEQQVTEYSLGELFVFKNGLNASKEQFGHGFPIINYVNVYKKNSIYLSDLTGKVNLDEKSRERYTTKRGDVFFTRTSETQEEIGIASVLLEDIKNGVFSGFVLRARPISNLLSPEFCKYCFASNYIRKQIIQSSTLTTRALTNGTSLSKVKILVPSLSEQARIVSILDKFEALVNDLSQGLPAEIEAVKEQYEYYRNKLLTFDKIS